MTHCSFLIELILSFIRYFRRRESMMSSHLQWYLKKKRFWYWSIHIYKIFFWYFRATADMTPEEDVDKTFLGSNCQVSSPSHVGPKSKSKVKKIGTGADNIILQATTQLTNNFSLLKCQSVSDCQNDGTMESSIQIIIIS